MIAALAAAALLVIGFYVGIFVAEPDNEEDGEYSIRPSYPIGAHVPDPDYRHTRG